MLLFLLLGCPPDDDGFTRTGDKDVWMLTWGGASTDELWAVDLVEDASGTAGTDVIAVAHETDVEPDVVARRFDATGAEIWKTTYGTSWADMAYVTDVVLGTAYVGGATFTGGGWSTADPLILALDTETGDTRWSWTTDPSGGYEEVDGLCIRGEDVWFTGWTGWGASATRNDPMIGRLTTAGEEQWVVADTTGVEWDEANGHCACDGSTIWVTGNRDGWTYAVGGQGVVAAYAADDGARLWQADLDPDPEQEDGYGLVSDGSALYSVGPSVTGQQTQITVWATDLLGTPIWSADWGDDGADIARAIALDGDSLVIAGTAGTDLVLLRIATADGALIDELVWSAGASIGAHEVVTDGISVWIAGQIAGDGDDAVLIRGQARPFALPVVEGG